MKTPKPFDLERCFEWAECQDSLSRKDMLFQLKEDVKTEVRSACKFWLKYRDNPEFFLKEFPDFSISVEHFPYFSKKIDIPFSKYNEWLFKLAFREVMEAEK